jgi:hypothetical protein
VKLARGTEARALRKAASSLPSPSRLPYGLNIVNCYFAMFNHMFDAFVDDLEKKSRLSSEFSGTLAEDSRFNI